jgi:hypothetical protein
MAAQGQLRLLFLLSQSCFSFLSIIMMCFNNEQNKKANII